MANGFPLREGKERLLKDGDRIGIAYLELQFVDGAMRRSGSHAWLHGGGGSPPLLDALRRAQALLARDDVTVAELEKQRQAIRAGLAIARAESGKAMGRMRTERETISERLGTLVAESAVLESVRQKLYSGHPPYDDILQGIDRVRQTTERALRRRVNLLCDPIAALSRSAA